MSDDNIMFNLKIENASSEELKLISQMNKNALRNSPRQRLKKINPEIKCWVCDTDFPKNKIEASHFRSLNYHKNKDSYGWVANHIDNLGWLCKLCHTEYDNQFLPTCRRHRKVLNGYIYLDRVDSRIVIIGSVIHGFIGMNGSHDIMVRQSFSFYNGPVVTVGSIINFSEIEKLCGEIKMQI